MKKQIITFILLIFISSAFVQKTEAQINGLRDTVITLQNNNFQLRKDFNWFKNKHTQQIEQLQKGIVKQNAVIDSLQKIISLNSQNISKTANDLGVKIEQTETDANQKFETVNQTISQNTLYWIIAILAVAILLLIVFVLLRKQIFKQKTDINQTIENTKTSLEQETVKLDEKLINLLETQLKVNAEQPKNGNEADHSLALRVADEIIRIHKNMSRMDEGTKGLKQLAKSVERIQNEFASNGYEIVEMLGKPFNEGMKVSANFIPDENLEKGKQIVSRIIKPQVNFKGEMIQSAQIEVSVGE